MSLILAPTPGAAGAPGVLSPCAEWTRRVVDWMRP